MIDFSPATPFTGLTTTASFKENSRKILLGGNNVVLEIDTTIGTEAVTMTYTGFTGSINRILPLEGSNFFLAAGGNRIVYKFDRTLAASQAQSASLSNYIRDIVKSRDSAGYILVTDFSTAIKVLDVTTGVSSISIINNSGNYNINMVAASSVHVQEFAFTDDNGGDDVVRVILTGTSASVQ